MRNIECEWKAVYSYSHCEGVGANVAASSLSSFVRWLLVSGWATLLVGDVPSSLPLWGEMALWIDCAVEGLDVVGLAEVKVGRLAITNNVDGSALLEVVRWSSLWAGGRCDDDNDGGVVVAMVDVCED